MSFVPLDTVDFSREEALEDTPVRIRAARCKSPVPESDRSRSFDNSRNYDRSHQMGRCASTAPRHADAAAALAADVQAAPVQQPSIPRHRPIAASRSELLRTIDESVSDLRDELNQHNRSSQSVRSDASQRSRISDICRKLDVIASVVLRHERELKEQSQMVMHASQQHVSAERSRPAYPAYSASEHSSRVHQTPTDESSVLMRSILKKVSEVNVMMEHVAGRAAAPIPATAASRDRSFASATDASSPLVRIADALDVVSRELQRQHSTIEHLARVQCERDEEERIASVMRYNPPSDVAPSETSTANPDEHFEAEVPRESPNHQERFAQRMFAAGVEFDSQRRDRAVRPPPAGDRTASVHTSTISVNEQSPQRQRVAPMRAASYEESASSRSISVNEQSPQRARVAPAAAAAGHWSRTESSTISVNEASPQRVRVAAPRSSDSRGSSRISVNEQSPQRARVAPASSPARGGGFMSHVPLHPVAESMDGSRTSSRNRRAMEDGVHLVNANGMEALEDEEPSPRRARAASAMAIYDDVDELVAADDAVADAEYYEPSEDFTSPSQRFLQRSAVRRAGSTTVPAKTSVAGDSTVLRTVTKQPEFLLRSASARKSHTRKPVVRADIFDNDSDTTSGGESDEAAREEESFDLMHSRMTTGAQDELIRRLRLENESLKRQLHSQLVRNDDLRSAVKEVASPGASRIGRSMLA